MKNATTAKQTRAGSPVLAGAASMENATMKVKPIAGHSIEYLACYRAGKSQYVGEWCYQIEVLIDGEREVHMEHASKTIKEAKMKFEGYLLRRFGRPVVD